MKINTVYKTLMAFAMIILSLASASGQDAYTVVRNSKIKYGVSANTEVQIYEWKVYTDTDLSIEADASSECKLTPVLGEPHSINVEWLGDGTYYLTLYATGTNGCTNKKAWKYTVVSTAIIAFDEIESSDCADDVHTFATLTVAELTVGNALAESQYPLKLNYEVTINGETKSYSADVDYDDQLLNIEGITEDVGNDKTYTIKIVEAKTKFGGEIQLGSDITHTRTIYALPPVSTINHN